MANHPVIRFGTAGWRSLIARDFTFHNVRLASQAVADYLKAELKNPKSEIHGRDPNVLLAYDCRFLGRDFALAVAEVFAANGLTPLIGNRDTPTPVLAFAIRKRKALAGVNITASHNPPEYSGFKVSRFDGAGAPPETTKPIEETIARLQRENWSFKSAIVGTFECKNIDPQAEYFKQIRKLVEFSTIKKARLKVAVDLMHGCGRGYLDILLAEAGANLTVLHEDLNPMFGGHPPEPSAGHLTEMIRLVRSGKARLGLATDGDADRFGVIDSDGTWITPNQVLALTLYHLAKHRGWKGAAVRTVVTSHQVDAVAAHFGVKIYEVPVGFKYVGAIMEREPVIVGGEESGGLSVQGHVPEKDGILACLLMAELVAAARKPLGAILKEITKLGGAFFTERINIHIDPAKKEELLSRLSGGLTKIGSFPVEKYVTVDGYKFLLPNGEWVAFRASGTEPVFRCYIEARSKKNLEPLRAACRALLS
ncbi:MAG TPA: phosphoglucomutase/phosphomannomutase family protein [Verrucomicrobiae bacterium]|jgi:phosphomannomutase|nr:phosphoglucomutase/phosphomannomutase family protein [Verrucomicrobiae bacterium]